MYHNEVEKLPWCYEALDNDLEEEIRILGLNAGRFLEYRNWSRHAGPVQLSNIGFSVTGTDISESAIKRARQLSDKVNFMVDNILETQLNEEAFDFIFNKIFSCHTEKRTDYVKTVHKTLAKDGFLFLKCST